MKLVCLSPVVKFSSLNYGYMQLLQILQLLVNNSLNSVSIIYMDLPMLTDFSFSGDSLTVE